MKLAFAIASAAMLALCALLARASIADAAVSMSAEADCDLQDVLALEAIDARLQKRLHELGTPPPSPLFARDP